MSMDQIHHKFIQVRGLKLHIADIGTGSNVVVFLHGFPEIWYSWRHQMIALADAGFRAIAPDFRGFGLSDTPTEPSKVEFSDLISVLLGILDALNIPKEHGRAEADFGRFDAKTIIRIVYILFSKSKIPIAQENQEIMDLVDPTTPLPPWLSEEDLATYGALYEKSGFDTVFKVPYRSLNGDWGIQEPKVKVPTILIMGEKDYTRKFPKIDEYIQGGKMKEYVPELEIIYLPEGSHFLQEQYPKEVNKLLLTFLAKNT